MRRHTLIGIVATLMISVVAGCSSGVKCGDGTTERDGRCVPVCGEGTAWRDSQCRPAASGGAAVDGGVVTGGETDVRWYCSSNRSMANNSVCDRTRDVCETNRKDYAPHYDMTPCEGQPTAVCFSYRLDGDVVDTCARNDEDCAATITRRHNLPTTTDFGQCEVRR